MAWSRAVEGWEEPIVRGGEVVGVRRRYSEGLLRLLLQHERAEQRSGKLLAGEGQGVLDGKLVDLPRAATAEETDADMNGLLDRLERRDKAEQLRWADEMVRRGLAP